MRKDLYQDLRDMEEKHWWHRAKREMVTEAVEETGVRRGKILEVGFGTGRMMEEMGDWGEVWGVDAAPEALIMARKRGIKNIKKGKAEKLPFADKSFDMVLLLDVLEHAEEKMAVREAFRVTKPGGKLMVTVPALPWLWSRWDEILGHKRRYTKTGLVQALENGGWRTEKIYYRYAFLVPVAWILRKYKSGRERKYTSDFRTGNRWTDRVALGLARAEKRWAKFVPWGTTVAAVATKPK